MIRHLIRITRRMQQSSASFVGRMHLRHQRVSHGPDLVLLGRPIVSRVPESRIQIGSGVTLCSSSRYAGLGANHPVILRTGRSGAEIRIGDGCGITGATILAFASIEIGPDCLLGANVTIVDSDFHPLDPVRRRDPPTSDAIGVAPVRIGRNVFIGMNVLVLKGVTIGDNSVIGAGSVVTTDIPANVIAAGNPCRVLRTLAETSTSAVGGPLS